MRTRTAPTSRSDFERAGLLAVAALIAGACAPGESGGSLELARLPEAPAEAVDAAASRQLEQARADVAELLETGAPPARLAEAVGHLGRLFHAYELSAEAESCYREASRLDPGDFRWPYLRGFLLQTRGDVDGAAGAYADALDRRDDHLPLLVRSAEVELARRRPVEAAELLARALELDPQSAAVHLGLGRLALERGEAEEAVRHLEQALALEPQASEIHYPLGLAYRQSGDLERARRHLERRGDVRVRLVDPPIAGLADLARGGDLPTRRGLEALAQGERERALEELRAAVASRPEDPEARRNLAIALRRLGDSAAAEREYRSLLELDPEDAAAHLALGTLLTERDALAEAVEHFRTAVRLAPDFKQAHYNLATGLAQLGRLDEALDVYDRLLELDAAFADARTRRALVLLEAGETERGRSELRAVVEERPTDVGARLALAIVLARLGEPDEARRTLEAGIEAAQDAEAQARLHLELARLLLAGGSAHDGLRHLDAADTLEPGLLDVAFERGRALLRLGRFAEAADELARVSDARPDVLTAWLAETEAWLRAGETGKARQRLDVALEHHPGDSELTDALARILATTPQRAVRDGERAYELARELFEGERTPRHAETLAMALAALGRFEEALDVQRALVASAAESGVGPQWRGRLEENLERYERGETARPLVGSLQ